MSIQYDPILQISWQCPLSRADAFASHPLRQQGFTSSEALRLPESERRKAHLSALLHSLGLLQTPKTKASAAEIAQNAGLIPLSDSSDATQLYELLAAYGSQLARRLPSVVAPYHNGHVSVWLAVADGEIPDGPGEFDFSRIAYLQAQKFGRRIAQGKEHASTRNILAESGMSQKDIRDLDGMALLQADPGYLERLLRGAKHLCSHVEREPLSEPDYRRFCWAADRLSRIAEVYRSEMIKGRTASTLVDFLARSTPTNSDPDDL